MTIGQAIKASLRYDQEATFGVDPAGTYTELRYTTETLESETTRAVATEQRTDRNIIASRRTGRGAGGGITGELASDNGNEEMMLAALQSDGAWPSPVGALDTTITITQAADSLVNDSGTGFVPPAVGDFALLYGWGDEANNRVVKVKSATTSVITTHSSNLVTDASATSAKTVVEGSQVSNGSLLRSYHIERAHADLTSQFEVYSGMSLESLAVGMTEGGFVSLGYEFMGKDETRPGSAVGATPDAASTNPQFSSPDDIGLIANDDDIDLVSFNFTVNNGLYPSRHANQLGNQALGSAQCTVSGAFSVLFEDATQLDRYLADTSISLAFWVANGQHAYCFELPQCRFKKGSTPTSAQSAPIVAEFEFDCELETGGSNTLRIWRFLVPA